MPCTFVAYDRPTYSLFTKQFSGVSEMDKQSILASISCCHLSVENIKDYFLNTHTSFIDKDFIESTIDEVLVELWTIYEQLQNEIA